MAVSVRQSTVTEEEAEVKLHHTVSGKFAALVVKLTDAGTKKNASGKEVVSGYTKEIKEVKIQEKRSFPGSYQRHARNYYTCRTKPRCAAVRILTVTFLIIISGARGTQGQPTSATFDGEKIQCLDEMGNKSSVNRICAAWEAKVPMPSKSLRHLMITGNIDGPLYTGLELTCGPPKWLNQNKVEVEMLPKHCQGNSLYVDLWEKKLKCGDPFRAKDGTVCYFKSGCKDDDKLCFLMSDGDSLAVYKKDVTWMEAAALCEEKGGTIAQFNSSTIAFLYDRAQELHEHVSDVWVGANRCFGRNGAVVYHYTWLSDQLVWSAGMTYCLVLARGTRKRELGLRAVHCSSEARICCQNETKPDAPDMTAPVKNCHVTQAGRISATVCSVISIVAGAFVMIKFYGRKLKTKKAGFNKNMIILGAGLFSGGLLVLTVFGFLSSC